VGGVARNAAPHPTAAPSASTKHKKEDLGI
jgi:hypothetical protein